MNRRFLFALIPAALVAKTPKFTSMPMGMEQINDFATKFNIYTTLLKSGRSDIPSWKAALEAWEAMTK